jgi:CCR4-NOT transcription complex subunit 9
MQTQNQNDASSALGFGGIGENSSVLSNYETGSMRSNPTVGGQSQSFLNNSSVSGEVKELIIQQIDELKYADKRDDALMALSQQREHFSELAPFIWHSVGTIAALLQEIVGIYPLLSPPFLD